MLALNQLLQTLVDLKSDVITRRFKDIDQYWIYDPNVQKIVPNPSPSSADLKTRIEADLKVGADGLLYQTARANAIM